jgi:hypothetical protein
MARVQRVAAAVRSPAEAWLVARMLAWALVLPALKARVSLKRLVALMWVDARRPEERGGASTELQVARLSKLAHRLSSAGRRDNCLERSLIAYRQLSARNLDPLLVVGTRSGPDGVEGHVWVTVDGRPLHDEATAVATFVPLTAFGAGGRRQPVG